MQSTSSSICWFRMLTSEFADCLLRAARYDEADMLLREAEQAVTETDERSHFAELRRPIRIDRGHRWRCAERAAGH
jgi:hypothetical protein